MVAAAVVGDFVGADVLAVDDAAAVTAAAEQSYPASASEIPSSELLSEDELVAAVLAVVLTVRAIMSLRYFY